MKTSLTREEKKNYQNCLLYFKNGIFHKEEKALIDYYLYEIANLVFDDRPEDAIRHMFEVRDRVHSLYDNNADMIRLCESMIIAHPECASSICFLLQSKGIRSYETYDAAVSMGDYSQIQSYVKKNARGLKENDMTPEKNYIRHSWLALEEVFYHLEDAFRDYKGYLRESYDGLYGVTGFRQIVAGGIWENIFLPTISLNSGYSRPSAHIPLSATVTLERSRGRNGKEQWVRKEQRLYDVSKDLLALIYQYTESIMRERLHAPKKKRSIEKIMKKSYRRNHEEAKMVHQVKQYISNVRFEQGIAAGIDAYLEEHRELLPKPKTAPARNKKKSSPDKGKSSLQKEIGKGNEKERLSSMDRGQAPENRSLDLEKLKGAKEDADYILSLLSVEEIAYHDEDTDDRLRKESAVGAIPAKEPASDPSCFLTEEEYAFLKALLLNDDGERERILKHLSITERLMVKEINEKALIHYEDVVLEYAGAHLQLVEDYIDDWLRLGEEKGWQSINE